MDKNTIFAMLFPLGTLENTSDTTWTWTLCAHLDKVKQAGVEFDPEARTLTSVQGIASSGSALQVCSTIAGDGSHILLGMKTETRLHVSYMSDLSCLSDLSCP